MAQYTYEKQTYELIPEGTYECTIDRIETKFLKEYEVLSISFKIRGDIEQPCGGRIVYETIWKEKEDKEHFNKKRINQLLGTQNIEEGTTFETIEDIIKFLDGANLQCHIIQSYNEYRDTTENRVQYFRSSNIVPQSIATDTPTNDMPDEMPF